MDAARGLPSSARGAPPAKPTHGTSKPTTSEQQHQKQPITAKRPLASPTSSAAAASNRDYLMKKYMSATSSASFMAAPRAHDAKTKKKKNVSGSGTANKFVIVDEDVKVKATPKQKPATTTIELLDDCEPEDERPQIVEDKRAIAVQTHRSKVTAHTPSRWVSVDSSDTKVKREDEDIDVPRPRKIIPRDDDDLDIPRTSNRSGTEDSDVPRPSKTIPRDDDDLDIPRHGQRDTDLDVARPSKREDDLELPRKRNNDVSQSHTTEEPRSKKPHTEPAESESDEDSPRGARLDSPEIGAEPDVPATEPKTDQMPIPSAAASAFASASLVQQKAKLVCGFTAGLTSSKDARAMDDQRKREEESKFNNVDPSLLGKGNEPVFRDKHGRKLEYLEELQRQEAKMKQKEEDNEKWGKGEVQEQEQMDMSQRLVEEKSKPFAQYLTDVPLDMQRREKDRWGDPMLQHVPKKKVESMRPKYSGPPPQPNRFNIEPDYLWDGVDRSNGFEKTLFEAKAHAVAIQEEAYKWSVSDM
ncbi:BUD13 protein [Pelomyxa schiedti]|nr:BUD13 protein [Pelomyxa schiedti]